MSVKTIPIGAAIAVSLICWYSIANAARPWAKGAEVRSTNDSSQLPPLWLRFGVSLTSTNSDRIEQAGVRRVSFKGVGLEAGIRPLSHPLSENVQISLEVPLAISALEGKYYGETSSGVLLGRIIPTVRMSLKLRNGKEIQPYVGFGAGSNLWIGGGGSDFGLVTAIRMGSDLMLTQKFGVGVMYTLNSLGGNRSYTIETITYPGGFSYSNWTSKGNLKLKELSLSLLIRL